MNRQEVVDIILDAQTREEVAHARQIRDEWLQSHPDDFDVLEASESLEMLAEAQDLIDNSKPA